MSRSRKLAAMASVLALAGLMIAPGPTLADPSRYHHDYYKWIGAHSAGVAVSSGFPWASVGAALSVAVVFATVLLTTLRRTHQTAT